MAMTLDEKLKALKVGGAEAAVPQQQMPTEDSSIGIVKSILSALREIPEGTVKAGSALSKWEAEKAAGLLKALGMEGAADSAQSFADEQWKPEQIDQATNDAIRFAIPGKKYDEPIAGTIEDFTQHQPETPTEETVSQVASFLPAILTKNPAGLSGGRALLSKAMSRVALPAAASDTAGDIAHEVAPDAESAVRFLVGAVANPSIWKGLNAQAAARQVGGNPAALRELRERIIADFGDTPEGMQRAQTALQEMGIAEGATLMDIGPNLKQAGQQVYSKPGAGREAIFSKLKGREEMADRRGEDLIRENVGPAVDEGEVLAALQERKSAGAAAQEAAHPAQVADVDLSPVVDKIDSLMATTKSSKIQSTLRRVRKTLFENEPADPDNPALETGSQPVLSARQAIGELLYEADGSPKAGIGPKEKQVLDDLYADINRQLDPANPTLRAADAEIAQAGKEQRAFKTGKEDVIDSNPNTAIAPEQFARDWDAASPGERATMRQGLTAKIDAMRGVTANDRAALKKIVVGDGKWNHRKIATIIGDEAADNLVRGLEREKTFQDTERGVLYNSKTAETSVDDGLAPAGIEMAKRGVERAAAGGILAGPTGMAGAAATAPITSGLTKLGDAMLSGRRAALGKMLASGQPDQVTRATQAVPGTPGRAAMVQMILQSLAAQQGGP